MKRSNRLVILVGVLLAVLAFVGHRRFCSTISQRRARSLRRRSPRRSSSPRRTSPSATRSRPTWSRSKEIDPEAVQGTPPRGARPSCLGPAGPLPDPGGLAGDRRRRSGSARRAPSHLLPARAGREGDRLPGRSRHRPRLPRHSRATTSTSSVAARSASSRRPPTLPPTRMRSPPRFEVVTGLEDQRRPSRRILQDKRVLYVSATRAIQPSRRCRRRRRARRRTQPAQAVIESVIIVFAGTDQDAEVIKFAQSDLSEHRTR